MLGTRKAIQMSRKEDLIKRWQLKNVNEFGMQHVIDEGKKMRRMTIEQIEKKYFQNK